jgi:tRNA pseudouridine65 synthase
MAGRVVILPILYRDDDLVVVNKPSGLLVHRGWGDDEVVAMTAVRDQLGRHVYPVHRLDRATSGALAFALHPEAARLIQRSFDGSAETPAEKRYIALVRGVPPEEVCVDHPIPRAPDGPRVPAVTSFQRLCVVLERFAVVRASPRTGRLHQVRRHLKHLSCPIIGDVNYGKGDHNRRFRDEFGLRRLALHALELSFDHPMTGARLDFLAPPPADLVEPFERIGVPARVWDGSHPPATLGGA